MPTPLIELRPPRWARVYVVCFSVVWCGAVLVATVAALVERSPAVVLPLLMLTFGATFGYRLSRLAVVADLDHLAVHNTWRTLRMVRADVEGFRVGSSSSAPFGKALHVLLRDGSTLPLDVTTEPYMRRRGRARLQARLEQLQLWQVEGQRG